MKFIANAKEIKTAIDKVMTVINKKVSLFVLKELYFESDVENNKVYIMGTDMEQWLKVEIHDSDAIFPGVFGMDYEDIKIFTKMNGVVTLESENENLTIVNEKKTVKLKCYEDFADISFPDMTDKVEKFSCRENWLLETTLKLSTYLSCDDNKMMQSFNFNLGKKRVEALDGHRICMRTLENINILDSGSLMIHGKCSGAFKKTLNKKSDSMVSVFQNGKYIEIAGETFTYWIRNVEGEYFNVEQMVKEDFPMSFDINGKEMKEVCEYIKYLRCNDDKKPVVLEFEENTLNILFKNAKYSTKDSLDIVNYSVNNDFRIGFNPQFLVDLVNTIDVDIINCKLMNRKAPIMAYGNEYSFVILPVNIKAADY